MVICYYPTKLYLDISVNFYYDKGAYIDCKKYTPLRGSMELKNNIIGIDFRGQLT